MPPEESVRLSSRILNALLGLLQGEAECLNLSIGPHAFSAGISASATFNEPRSVTALATAANAKPASSASPAQSPSVSLGKQKPRDEMEPRNQPGAYLTDGRHLFEVIELSHSLLLLEDCGDQSRRRIQPWRVRSTPWRLVKAAPVVPDDCEAAA